MPKVCLVAAGILSLMTPIWAEKGHSVERWATIVANEFTVSPNIPYGPAGNNDLRLDVVTVAPSSDKRPAVIFIHGGGWVGGSKEVNMFRPMPYLARGMNVVNVEYRKASVALAPAAVEDCRCALRWVFRHADEFGFDTARLVLVGRSAGAHLALMTGMLEPNNEFDAECPGSEPLKVAAIVNFYGITDVNDVLTGPHTQEYALKWFAGFSDRAELARKLSPLTYVRPGLPPIITLHGDADTTVPYQQGVRLHQALLQAGVESELVTVPGGGHDSWNRQDNLRTQDAIFKFLERHHIIGPVSP